MVKDVERKLAYFVSERMNLASILTSKRMQDTVFGLQNWFSGPSRVNKVSCMQTAGKSFQTKLESTHIQRSLKLVKDSQ